MLNMIGTVFAIIVVVVAMQMGGVIGREASKAVLSPSQDQIERALIEGLNEAARQSNSRGPIMVDQDTRMDRTEVGPGARVTYFFSLPRNSSYQMDRNWLLANIKPKATRDVCGSSQMRLSLKHGVVYVYAYSGNDGIQIARFQVSRSDCGW